jgi:hypothetical protein
MHDPHDPSDFELEKTDQPPAPPRETRSAAPWIVTAIVLVLAGGAAWFFLDSRQAPPADVAEAPAGTEVEVPPDAAQPLGPDVEPIELPPLDDTDVLVRSLVRALSTHPRVVGWLATDNLVRNFTVAVENIANGRVPAQPLRALRPSGRFEIIETETLLVVDPASFERYNSVADAVSSVDAAGAARLYASLKPRIDEAYAELGSGQPFDPTLERAIVALLQVPAIEGDVHLVPQGGVFGFEDPAIEKLTPAQKQFARMGPRNVRAIQGKLRQIALALGIPASRLPGS